MRLSLDRANPWLSYDNQHVFDIRKGGSQRTPLFDITVVAFATERQVPPLSLSFRAVNDPFPALCSMTSRLPAPSNCIPRGLDRPVAMICALYPDATLGLTELLGEMEDEQPD